MKLTVPQIQIDEREGFSPDKDIFNHQAFGESLLSVIQNSDEELVVALDAPWGEGKTTFVKMWRGYLYSKNIKSVYFDAFENDYLKDPFLAISSRLYELIDEEKTDQRNEFKQKSVKVLKTIGRAGLKIGVKALTAGVLDDTVFENVGVADDLSDEASSTIDSFIAERIESAVQDRRQIGKFRDYLDQMSSELGGDNPIVFIVDELDRCKPNFALELIESIKHIFSVKSIIFMLVMNRGQIEESIRCSYGSGIDATKYLQKFVSLWAHLPKKKAPFESAPSTYLQNCLKRMDFNVAGQNQSTLIENFVELIEYYDLSLREIEKSLTNFAIIMNVTGGNLVVDYLLIAAYISVVKVLYPTAYRKLSNGKCSYTELVHDTNLQLFQAGFWKNKPEGHPLRWLLRLHMSSSEEALSLLEKGDFRTDPSHSMGAHLRICKWLDMFKRDLKWP